MIKYNDLSIFLKIVVWAVCMDVFLEVMRFAFHLWSLN